MDPREILATLRLLHLSPAPPPPGPLLVAQEKEDAEEGLGLEVPLVSPPSDANFGWDGTPWEEETSVTILLPCPTNNPLPSPFCQLSPFKCNFVPSPDPTSKIAKNNWDGAAGRAVADRKLDTAIGFRLTKEAAPKMQCCKDASGRSVCVYRDPRGIDLNDPKVVRDTVVVDREGK